MAVKKNDILVYFHEIPRAKKYWGWFFLMGLLLVILGALAIGYAKWATEFTIILLGFLLAGAGVLQVINGIYASRWTGYSLSLLLGIFYIIVGALCIFKPMQSATGISLLIAALLLVGGAFRVFSALKYRFDNWAWVVFNGLVAFLLGLLILGEWPQDAMWVIGLFVGIDLVMMGLYWIWLSMAARKS